MSDGAQPRTRRTFGLAAPAAFVMMWSSGAIFSELGLRSASPFAFLALRAAIAAVIAWTVARCIRDTMPADGRAWRRLLLVGVIMQGGYQLLFLLSLDHGVSVGTLAAILGMQPVLTGLLSGRARPAGHWLAVGFGGLLLVAADAINLRDFSDADWGVAAAAGALLCMTFGTMAQPRLAGIGEWSCLAVQQTATFVLLAALGFALGQTAVSSNPGLWASLLWMATVVSTGATVLLMVIARRGDATSVSSLFYLVPPATAALDRAVYGTSLHALQWVGLLFITLALIGIRLTPRPAHHCTEPT